MQLRRLIAETTAYCDEHGCCACVTIRESTTIREKKCGVVESFSVHIETRLTLTHCTPASLLLTGRTYIHHCKKEGQISQEVAGVTQKWKTDDSLISLASSSLRLTHRKWYLRRS